VGFSDVLVAPLPSAVDQTLQLPSGNQCQQR